MIVSTQMAVLPVWRSPMINSRCPRPIGIIASIGLMPVCTGRLTLLRSITPGAMRSMLRNFARGDRPFAVQRPAQRIDHAAQQRIAHGHRRNALRAAHQLAFFNIGVLAQNDHADALFFQVERDAQRAVRETRPTRSTARWSGR